MKKAYYRHLLLIIALLLVLVVTTKAQDTTRTHVGYDIDYPHMYVRVDTAHCITQIYNYYPSKMYFTVNDNDTLLVTRKQVFTVWRNDFTLKVERGDYSRVYQFY